MTASIAPDHLGHVSTSDGVRLAYALTGADHLPVLVLANSIGTNLLLWGGQVEALARHFPVLRHDFRGHAPCCASCSRRG